jgi:MarR family transcriptional regulator, organic hydroperoxide resistance regulator
MEHKKVDLELSKLLQEMLGLIHRRSAGDTLAVMNAAAITMPQLVALFGLRKFGAHSVCDIADKLNLSRAATSHLVERLVQAKLVSRVEDEGDRRQKRVSINARGMELLGRIDRTRIQEFAGAVAKLSPALRHALRDVLLEVVSELNEHDRGSSPSRMRKKAKASA